MPYSEEGRWACAHLEPMPALGEPGQPHVRIRSPLRPSTCSSSFIQLHFFLTVSVPASTSTLYTPYFWLSLSSDGPFTLSMCWITPLHIFHKQSVTLQTHLDVSSLLSCLLNCHRSFPFCRDPSSVMVTLHRPVFSCIFLLDHVRVGSHLERLLRTFPWHNEQAHCIQ